MAARPQAQRSRPPVGPALLFSGRKTPLACLENVWRLLTTQTDWAFAFNEMGGVVTCNGKRVDGPTITAITRWCHTRKVMAGSQSVAEVIAEVADAKRCHPVRDYLAALKWDGIERLDMWLPDFLGAESAPYVHAIGRKWLISAVARAMRPGCKADHVLVLEGPQGILKSTALGSLCHDDSWLLEDLRDINGKDALMQFGGKWLVEIAELQSFKGAESAKLKAFISTKTDNFRPPYARAAQDFPRSIVLAGTVNEDQYLKDVTGGRRFWCFECGTINIAGLTEARDQLWAEATAAFHAGESWWLDDPATIKDAQLEQEKRRVEDPWEQPVADFLDGATETTVSEVLSHLEQPPGGGMTGPRAKIARTKADQMRVADVLKCLGWQKHRVGDQRTRIWRKVSADAPTPDPPTSNQVGLGKPRRIGRYDPPDPPGPPVCACVGMRVCSVGK